MTEESEGLGVSTRRSVDVRKLSSWDERGGSPEVSGGLRSVPTFSHLAVRGLWSKSVVVSLPMSILWSKGFRKE